MARKSKAEIESEVVARHEEMNRQSETRAMELFSGFMTNFMGQMGQARAAAGPDAAPANPEGDLSLGAQIAHAMQVASASPSKRAALITPEQKADRAEAWKEMIRVLTENQARGLMPIFRVTKQTFLAETIIYPNWRDPVTKQLRDQEVNWPGIPNEAMAPLEVGSREQDRRQIEAGQVIFALYKRWIGHNAGVNQNAPTPFIVNGKDILRGNAPAPAPVAAASAPGFDPRRLGSVDGVTQVPILGTVAAPAVVTP